MTSILLVEDHEIFAQALLRVLEQKGQLEVKAIARSAEEALMRTHLIRSPFLPICLWLACTSPTSEEGESEAESESESEAESEAEAEGQHRQAGLLGP